MKVESGCYVAGFSQEIADSIANTAHPAGIPTTVVSSVTELITRLRTETSGCLILPLDMVGREPVMAEIATRSPAAGLIFIASTPDTRLTVEAMRIRATHDVVEWPRESSRLATGISEVLAASTERAATMANERHARRLLSELTQGERQVLDLMAAGMANKKVAPALGIALRTVEARRKRIFAKLGTRSLLEIANLLHITSEAKGSRDCGSLSPPVENRYLKLTSA